MARFLTNSPEETEALGEKLSKKLVGGEVIAFKGGMGMGKTVFTRGLARGLGITRGVSSPTFAIVKEYSGSLTVYHFDMYRISGGDDLYSCGFFDYLDGESVMMIEWSENIEEYLPENTAYISISRTENENERIIEINGIEI